MKKVYSIQEYGSFITGKEAEGCVTLPESTFRRLENFLLSSRSADADALELMGLSSKKGLGRVITAKHYVGVISMKDGTTIEILPKLCSSHREDWRERAIKLLIEMLKTLRNAPYKSLQTANVGLEKLSLFEVFIRMFVKEVFWIAKRGLRRGYTPVEQNEPFFKGKIQFSQQLQTNYCHKERSFVTYDLFSLNRPENRLLKATLLTLHGLTGSTKNKIDIKSLLGAFGDVPASTDYSGDFASYAPDRGMRDYGTALLWSRVFLMGKSFTAFAGSEIALALLFPMETLFESYIAAQLRKTLNAADFALSAQDKTHYLFQQPGRKFLLKPDLVVTRKRDGAVFVLDTKWKILAGHKKNYGISPSDMYQMYVYQKKYGAEHITLVYPLAGQQSAGSGIEFASDDGARVMVRFVDFFQIRGSMTALAALFAEET